MEQSDCIMMPNHVCMSGLCLYTNKPLSQCPYAEVSSSIILCLTYRPCYSGMGHGCSYNDSW